MTFYERDYFNLKRQVEDLTNERDYYKQKYEELMQEKKEEINKRIIELQQEINMRHIYATNMLRNPEDAYREDFSI